MILSLKTIGMTLKVSNLKMAFRYTSFGILYHCSAVLINLSQCYRMFTPPAIL